MIDFSVVPALMSKRELPALYKIAETIDGNVIEVGSWKGGSTIVIASGLKSGKIYAIDPHKNTTAHEANKVSDTYSEFLENLKKFNVTDKVIPIRKTSEEAFRSWDKGNVEMVYIDGNHDYEYAKYDIESWLNHLKKGGILVIHDFGINGNVADVVLDCVVDKLKFVKRVDSLVVFKNESKTGFLGKTDLKIYKVLREFIFRNSKKKTVRLVVKLWNKVENIKDVFNN